jgi:transposase-like protein
MPVLSHLHQLFNAEQCQAYIHTLRWKDRPLQCPRCQSHHIGCWGTYQYRPGCKRYWCHDCKRTFNDLTATLLHQSQRSLSHWILATFLLCLACSSRRIAREVGVHIRTSWCWWLRVRACKRHRLCLQTSRFSAQIHCTQAARSAHAHRQRTHIDCPLLANIPYCSQSLRMV